MSEKANSLKKFDPADHLNTPEECAAYLAELNGDSVDMIRSGVLDVVRAVQRMVLGGLAAPALEAPAVHGMAVHEYIEGGRESVDDALAIVESFGSSIEGVNDEFARQIILAAEVRRLRGLCEQAVNGRSAFRDAYRKARDAILPPLGCPACSITHDAKGCPQESAMAAAPQAPAAPSAWDGPVRELLGHLSDVLDDESFAKIDTARWNAVSALVAAAEREACANDAEAFHHHGYDFTGNLELHEWLRARPTGHKEST